MVIKWTQELNKHKWICANMSVTLTYLLGILNFFSITAERNGTTVVAPASEQTYSYVLSTTSQAPAFLQRSAILCSDKRKHMLSNFINLILTIWFKSITILKYRHARCIRKFRRTKRRRNRDDILSKVSTHIIITRIKSRERYRERERP